MLIISRLIRQTVMFYKRKVDDLFRQVGRQHVRQHFIPTNQAISYVIELYLQYMPFTVKVNTITLITEHKPDTVAQRGPARGLAVVMVNKTAM